MYHKYNTKVSPIVVNQNEVDYYINECDSDSTYVLNKESLDDLFKKYPSSTELKGVRNKSTALNEYYSTRVKSIDLIPLAKWICSIRNIDNRIKAGDPTIVNEMASSKTIGGKTTEDAYSFASKYCHFHNPNKYPIFDSFVHDMLFQLQKEYDFYRKQLGVKGKFTQNDLKDYTKFIEIRQAFVEYFKLTKNSILDIDKFFWRAGKYKYFNKKDE